MYDRIKDEFFDICTSYSLAWTIFPALSKDSSEILESNLKSESDLNYSKEVMNNIIDFNKLACYKISEGIERFKNLKNKSIKPSFGIPEEYQTIRMKEFLKLLIKYGKNAIILDGKDSFSTQILQMFTESFNNSKKNKVAYEYFNKPLNMIDILSSIKKYFSRVSHHLLIPNDSEKIIIILDCVEMRSELQWKSLKYLLHHHHIIHEGKYLKFKVY
ncbi:MAG: hypothetical protein MHMPM18_000475 [Marteilia pararefringens]